MLVWLLEEYMGGSTSTAVLYRLGARPETFGFYVPPWRLVTSIFLHYGFFHLAGNAFALLAIGMTLERIIPAYSVLFFFIYSGLCASSLSFYMTPQIASVGASGAILGLTSCLFLVICKLSRRLPLSYRRWSIILLAVCLIHSWFAPLGTPSIHIDRWNHIGGILGGFLTGTTLIPTSDPELPLLRVSPLRCGLICIVPAAAIIYFSTLPQLFM